MRRRAKQQNLRAVFSGLWIAGGTLLLAMIVLSAIMDRRGSGGGGNKLAAADGSASEAVALSAEEKQQRLIDRYVNEIIPIFNNYCYDCHDSGSERGGLSLDSYKDLASMHEDRRVWKQVRDHLEHLLMPPPDREQPTITEREQLIAWIDDAIFTVDPTRPDPGSVTLRRLNRVEYANTMHDLIGVRPDVDSYLPPDDTGYGFDNIGDVLSMSPVLMERYLMLAQRGLDELMQDEKRFARVISPRDEGEAIEEYYGRVIEGFGLRAFRRPLHGFELERLVELAMEVFREEEDPRRGEREGVRFAMEALLASPSFLFRGSEPESEERSGGHRPIQAVSEFDLASRLSYFLWSTMPDERLLQLASEGRLRQQLDKEINRMLGSPKSQALIENFGGQWLQLRDVNTLHRDRRVAPDWDGRLRRAMYDETRLLFDEILRRDLNVLTFLNADFTYLNERLAEHYGMEGIEGNEMRRVSLRNSPRRGILGHASILTLTSNPNRTSPVLRGKWVLENILNTPPPPPPPDVPDLPPAESDGEKVLTHREQLILHQADPACSSCHAMMDPIGFAMENFDFLGRWRDEEGGEPIDGAGSLHTGEVFDGYEELQRILAEEKQKQFVGMLADKLLTYALGRGLEYYDQPAVEQIVDETMAGGYRFSALVRAIVFSVPFQYERSAAFEPM